MLTVHHLGRSQSERIVWLCEELEIPYRLKCYRRDPVTMLAPPEYKALHPIGAAPVITDGDLMLAESGAVVEYIIGRYGNGRLALDAGHRDYSHFLYWFHFANGTLQANMGRNMILNRLKLPEDNPIFHSPPCAISCPTISRVAPTFSATSGASAAAKPTAGRWKKVIPGWPCC